MTNATKRVRRAAPLPAATLAALLLAGCSSGHIGESWQCPLAKGGTCDSVATADPAVPDMDAARNTVLGEPLWRVRATELDTPAPPPCSADCGGGFDPFAWLARLFDGETDGGEKAAAPGPVRLLPVEASAPAVPPADPVAAHRKPGPAETDPAPFPAEQNGPEISAADEAAPGDHNNFRTDEVVARIWIAPFVDADGVYREASYVRVVLEPAGWRLGR